MLCSPSSMRKRNRLSKFSNVLKSDRWLFDAIQERQLPSKPTKNHYGRFTGPWTFGLPVIEHAPASQNLPVLNHVAIYTGTFFTV